MNVPRTEASDFLKTAYDGYLYKYKMIMFSFTTFVLWKCRRYISHWEATWAIACQSQQAVDRIDDEIGRVIHCASVYEVPAVGFSGADFLNTCLVASSSKTPNLILKNLQAIESALGREQASDGHYHDRPIDLDLIMVDDQVINTSTLTVPHPRLHERRFVLQPLLRLLRKRSANHDQTIAQLLRNVMILLSYLFGRCDRATSHSFFTSIQSHLCGGNHWVWKNKLGKANSRGYSCKTLLRAICRKPLLPKFYDNAERYAFPLEMSFLADRFKQQHELSDSPIYLIKGLCRIMKYTSL